MAKGKAPAEIRSLARSHTEAAIRTLAHIMREPKAAYAARVMAAIALLDRGWGKPPQTVELKDVNSVILHEPLNEREFEAQYCVGSDAGTAKGPNRLLS